VSDLLEDFVPPITSWGMASLAGLAYRARTHSHRPGRLLESSQHPSTLAEPTRRLKLFGDQTRHMSPLNECASAAPPLSPPYESSLPAP